MFVFRYTAWLLSLIMLLQIIFEIEIAHAQDDCPQFYNELYLEPRAKHIRLPISGTTKAIVVFSAGEIFKYDQISREEIGENARSFIRIVDTDGCRLVADLDIPFDADINFTSDPRQPSSATYPIFVELKEDNVFRISLLYWSSSVDPHESKLRTYTFDKDLENLLSDKIEFGIPGRAYKSAYFSNDGRRIYSYAKNYAPGKSSTAIYRRGQDGKAERIIVIGSKRVLKGSDGDIFILSENKNAVRRVVDYTLLGADSNLAYTRSFSIEIPYSALPPQHVLNADKSTTPFFRFGDKVISSTGSVVREDLSWGRRFIYATDVSNEVNKYSSGERWGQLLPDRSLENDSGGILVESFDANTGSWGSSATGSVSWIKLSSKDLMNFDWPTEKPEFYRSDEREPRLTEITPETDGLEIIEYDGKQYKVEEPTLYDEVQANPDHTDGEIPNAPEWLALWHRTKKAFYFMAFAILVSTIVGVKRHFSQKRNSS